MRPLLFLVSAFVTLSGCTPPPPADAARLQKEFSDIASLQVELVNASMKDEANLRLIFAALRKAKSDGKTIDVVTRVELVSASKATISFTWSGGFHGGAFTIEEKDGLWSITSESYFM